MRDKPGSYEFRTATIRASRVKISVILTLALVSSVYLFSHGLPSLSTALLRSSDIAYGELAGSHWHTGIDVIDHIYVLSLPGRLDRREEMAVLAERVGLEWTMIDATPISDPSISAAWHWVSAKYNASFINDTSKYFSWPSSIERLADSDDYLARGDIPVPPRFDPKDASLFNLEIPVAAQNNSLSKDMSSLPDWMYHSRGRVACWHSHLTAIHRIANLPRSNAREPTALILEDDVDMEREINSQLNELWGYLPEKWDIVFLGHCWSDEAHHPAISKPTTHGKHSHNHALSSEGTSSDANATHALHPSFMPKCTHAYALSRRGARRLLMHLRYDPFAYSRAIDQAFEWLILTERLKSFSVVPPLVVQRRVSKSDIKEGGFGVWEEHLFNGVFEGAALAS